MHHRHSSKFLFFVCTWVPVWNDLPNARVLHPEQKLTSWCAWARMDGFSHATESGKNGPPVTVRTTIRAVTWGR